MNELVVRAFPAYQLVTGEPQYRLDWIVDGVSLMVAVRAAEMPVYANTGFRDSAGSYLGVREDGERGPNQLQLLEVARESEPASLLYVCSCGFEECSAIVATLSRGDGVVSWWDIRPTNGAVNPPRPFGYALPDLAFDEDAYDLAFAHVQRAEGPMATLRRPRGERALRRNVRKRPGDTQPDT